MTILSPGANAPVPAGDLTALIRHGTIPGAEIDVSAFLVTANGKVRSDADMCFYGQSSIAGGAVALVDTDNEGTRFTVAPDRIPDGIEKVIFTATIHENRATFGQLPEVGIDLGGVRGQIPCSGMTETALILAEIYKRNGAWKLRVVGQGFNGGLAALATHLGVDIAEAEPAPALSSAPRVSRTPTPPTPDPAINLNKVSLTKQNNSISLKKGDGRFGKIRVNLNWNQNPEPRKTGFFSRGSSTIDLDVGAFVETIDGTKSVVQALGNGFGDFQRSPFTRLLGDDRTGAVTDGEWLEINGDRWSDIRRILVFAFIYEGAPNWQATDGVIRVLIPGQPEVEVRMNEHAERLGMCAVAVLENQGGEVRVSREVTFHNGHAAMDKRYGWGFRWTAGRK